MPKRVEPITAIRREEVEFFISLFQGMNVDLYRLLRQARVPNDIHDSDYAYLPESTVKNLIGILGEQSTQEQFAMNVWQACRERYIPKYVQLLTPKRTVKDALIEFCQLLPKFNSGAKVSLQNAGNKWWLVREKSFSDDVWFKYAELFSVIYMNELLYALVGDSWLPTEIGIQSLDSSDFAALPGMNKVQFFTERPVTALLIPDSVLSLKANTDTPPNKLPDATVELTDDFIDTFKTVIKPYLSMGKLPIKWASEILNMNVRTIQRKLDAENVTYSQLIEDMVLEETLKLLNNTELSITAIATKMGYSDSAHFTRAFKRQMKVTPRQFRKNIG